MTRKFKELVDDLDNVFDVEIRNSLAFRVLIATVADQNDFDAKGQLTSNQETILAQAESLFKIKVLSALIALEADRVI